MFGRGGVRIFGAFCLVAALTACARTPSEGEIRRLVLAEAIDQDLAQFVEISEFRKTNGYEPGSNSYVADIQYKVTFRKRFAEMAADLEKEAAAANSAAGRSNAERAVAGAANAVAGIGLLALAFQYGEFQAGDSFERSDRVSFIKTENGWQLSSKPHGAL